MIFGDKDRFAIEIDERTFRNGRFINLRLLIGGMPVGSLDDSSMISLVISFITQAVQIAVTSPPIEGEVLDSEIFHDVFCGEDEFCYGVRTEFGEAFDDFLLLVCNIGDDKIRYIWRLVEDPFFEYPQVYMGEIFGYSVPVTLVMQTIDSFRAWHERNTLS